MKLIQKILQLVFKRPIPKQEEKEPLCEDVLNKEIKKLQDIDDFESGSG